MLLIHFLQRRAKVEVISTLFLLERTQRESTSGRRFDRLVNSIPLWLQCLAIILLTWLLCQPRYIQAKSIQRIAIVLDSSASMQVFHSELAESLPAEISRLQGNAAQIDLWLLESDPDQSRLYRGASVDELLAAAAVWQPSSGMISPDNTLRVARSLIGAEGALSYITDTPPAGTLPYHSSSLSIGRAIDNCGITGVSFEQRGENLIWKVLIRNYSNSTQSRSWKLEAGDAEGETHKITLAAGQLATIQGLFPNTHNRCRVSLNSDAFDLDDSIPLVRPEPKSLSIHSALPSSKNAPNKEKLARKLQASFPNIEITGQTSAADLILTSTSTTPERQHLIVMPRDKSKQRPHLSGAIVREQHPLMDGLNWQTLIARDTLSIGHQPADEVLLWQGKRAMIFLRTHPQSGKHALMFNFDIDQSNALKQPSTAVLLLRFCEMLRQNKMAPDSRMTETSEPIQLSHDLTQTADPLLFQSWQLDGSLRQQKEITPPIQAPKKPGFFTISQAEAPLLNSACYFADTREANFSDCTSAHQPASERASAIDRHTSEDHLWRLWALLSLLAVIGAWHYTASHPKQSN